MIPWKSDMSDLKTSIIVPSYNKSTRLRCMLSSLESQTLLAKCEIIIVDDASTDETSQVIHDLINRLPLKYISNRERMGRSFCRNKGAAASEAELLIFLDDDILVLPTFIEQHLLHQDKKLTIAHGSLMEMIGLTNVNDPLTGGIGILPLNLEVISREGFSPVGHRLVKNILETTIEKMYNNQLPKIIPWLSGVGANLAVPKIFWKALGGYNENFGCFWGCEDLEFAFRAHQAGYSFSILPDATGFHLSHHRVNRWEEHEKTHQFFVELHPYQEVIYLDYLLGVNGSIDNYFNKLNSS